MSSRFRATFGGHVARLVCALSLSFGTATAHAESLAPEPNGTFRYRSPQRAYFGRAAVEELVVLGGEMAQYWKDREINSEDWDLSYSWASFRDKLTGVAYSFDTNRFTTNFAYHPAAGTLYYLAPRANRATVVESLGIALGASTVWEIVAELRERVSINDMWVTPLSGLSFGETATQLGAFFDRGCPTRYNQALGFLFGPTKTLHDRLDGAVLERAKQCDGLGFDTASEHRFFLSVGAAQVRAAGGEHYALASGRLDTQIVNLPQDEPSSGWTGFSDGNLSELALGLSYGGGQIRDVLVEARTTIAGAQYRAHSLQVSPLHRGDRAVFGVVVGTQYSLHRYLYRGPLDNVFLVDAPAVTVRLSGRRPGYGFELALDAGGTFGGMSALALPDYQREHADEGLTTIARNQGYNYVVGVALIPRARLELEGVELGLSARSERVTAIRVLDRYATSPGTATVPDGELRRRASLWLSLGPRKGVRTTLNLEAAQRSGSVASHARALSELSVGLSLGAAL